MVQLSKTVFESSSYPLLPNRLMFPEKYIHQPSSIESKRALIYSMEGNLNDSERQKKQDTAMCEEFTRCRVGKGRDSRSSFEYFDIDANVAISDDDYERR